MIKDAQFLQSLDIKYAFEVEMHDTFHVLGRQIIVIVVMPGLRCFDAPTTRSIDRSVDR